AYLSRQLATIRCDVPLDIDPDELAESQPDREALLGLFRELEFKAWLDELLREGDADPADAPRPQAERSYDTLLDWSGFEAWLACLKGAELFAFDTETTSLDYMQAEVVGLSFAVEPGSAAYVPLAHDYPGAPEQLDR